MVTCYSVRLETALCTVVPKYNIFQSDLRKCESWPHSEDGLISNVIRKTSSVGN